MRYKITQRIRKRVEEIIGWFKTTGDLARARLVGRWKNQMQILITASAYNTNDETAGKSIMIEGQGMAIRAT